VQLIGVGFVSSKKSSNYSLTSTLLKGFRKAAVDNARELQYEAALLLSNNHYSRAYFLASACIEEIGKAVQAFDALGRNVRDPEVSTRVRLNFQDYSKKVAAAAFPWLLNDPNCRDEVSAFIESLIESKNASEPALFVGIEPQGMKLHAPSADVTKESAEECVQMARNIFAHASLHVLDAHQKVRTKAEDDFFVMKPSSILNVSSGADFWQYYIACMKSGDSAFEAALMDYTQKYLAKNERYGGLGVRGLGDPL